MSLKKLIEPLSEKDIKDDLGNIKRSLKYAKQMSKADPDRAGSQMYCHLYNSIAVAARLRDEKLMDELHAQVEAIEPGNERLRATVEHYRAKLRVAEHNFDEAIVMLEEMVKHVVLNNYTTHLNNLSLLIEIYEHFEDYESAVPYIHEFSVYWVKDHNDSYGYCSHLGGHLQILGKAGDYESVIKYGQMRLDLKCRSDHYYYFMVGQSYLQLGDEKKALEYFAYIMNRKTSYPAMYINLGAFYAMQRQDLELAITYMIKAVEDCRGDAYYKSTLNIALGNLGKMYTILNNPEKANAYRQLQFKALKTPDITDLFTMFRKDPASMEAYKAWLEEGNGSL